MQPGCPCSLNASFAVCPRYVACVHRTAPQESVKGRTGAALIQIKPSKNRRDDKLRLPQPVWAELWPTAPFPKAGRHEFLQRPPQERHKTASQDGITRLCRPHLL
jgi:hypothetical protein